MGTLLQTCLVLHIAGIVLLGGTTLMNYVISRQFWRYAYTDSNRAMIIHSTTLTFGRVTAIGGVLTILTGVAMVAILHGAVDSQLWFRIKMALVLLIILNSIFFAGPQNKRLKSMLSLGEQAGGVLTSLRLRMNLYYALQLTLLLTIFVLSVFKFN